MYFAPATEPRCGGRAAGCTSVPFYVPNGLCSFSTQPSPPARRRGSLHVNFRVILLSYRRLITRRLGNLVTLPCYCLLVITATPLRRLRYAVTRAPLSRSLRDGSGRLGTGPGSTRQSKFTIIHPCARQLASAPMGPAPRPRARRASLRIGWPGIGPGQGNRARKFDVRPSE